MARFGVMVHSDSGPGILHQLSGVVALHRGDILSVDIISQAEAEARVYFEIDMESDHEGLIADFRKLLI